MKKDSVWYQRMIQKYKTDEAISAVMSREGKKSIAARKARGTVVGGFSVMTEEQLKEVGKKGATARWSKNESSKI